MLPTVSPRTIVMAAVALVVVLFLLLVNPFWQINSGYVGVISDFGSLQPVELEPGLHVAIPFYQQIMLVSVQPQTTQSDETASTHDLQVVNTSIAVTFHVNPAEAPFFYQNFRDFETLGTRIISPAVSNDVKEVTANYDAEELVTKRDIVDAQIKSLIVSSLAPYHLTVEAVNVANFAFSEAYTQAIEAKQVAQQQALQAQYTLQQTQISAQQQVVVARAQADAAVATATGSAQATILQAQADAHANDLVNASLTPSILQLKAILKWSGAMPQFLSAGTALPFIGNATLGQGK
jgi:regulator of protease activity HflC (stomatin/prohibitin superfamily)